ncbi:MAG: choice-of-anchor I family protein [Thermohalobaculum sp.]|nr:choice-of-anchor I family protein [Thermohalobaculum sp.]
MPLNSFSSAGLLPAFTAGLSAELSTTERDASTLGVDLTRVFDSGSGETGSEVVAYFDGRLYVTNGAADRIDIFDAVSGALVGSLDLTTIPGFDGLQSVDVSADGIAVAVDIANLADPTLGANGVVARFALDGTPIDTVEVGNLPDMLTYSKDGTLIFVANEGEPEDADDPKGSISIVDVATGTAETFTFDGFDAVVDDLRAAGVRIFPGRLPSTDFEPEYIAEGPDGKLYVGLQEANAIAVFDLASRSWEKIIPLGTVDHAQAGFGIDPSDRDDAIAIQQVEVQGLRMPDAIAVSEIDGQTFIFTANEGDSRDFDESRGRALVDGDLSNGEVDLLQIDPAIAAALADNTRLGRLTFSNIDGDTDGDGLIEVLHSYGSRSFTIFDTDGNVVFDSGDDFEQIIAALRVPNAFNNDGFPSDDADVVDENRSDNKGPEPEAIAIGRVGDVTLAFIGLERDSGIMVYDVSDPANARFLDYIDAQADGNVSPEVIQFIPAEDSPTGVAQIAVSFEVSGTTALYAIELGREIEGTRRADTIAGSIGDDLIAGGNGADRIDGRGGDDEIRGGNGADDIFGGAGDDAIFGGNGRDRLSGGLGDDTLRGGNGADLIHGGAGDDWLDGGRGADRFVFALGDGHDTVASLERADRIDLSATGLGFGDLAITDLGSGSYEIALGDDDSITVTLARGNATLDAADFVF